MKVTIESGKLAVVDPCYLPKHELLVVEANVPNGTWPVEIEKVDLGEFGVRVGTLTIRFQEDVEGELETEELGMAGVDSGQMMMFDPARVSEYVNQEGPYEGDFDELLARAAGTFSYLGVSHLTIKEDAGEIGDGIAVASRTGMGDGVYPVIATKAPDGSIVSVHVDFGMRQFLAEMEREKKPSFMYVATVYCETQEQADQVMIERLGHDEDYGFEYEVVFKRPPAE